MKSFKQFVIEKSDDAYQKFFRAALKKFGVDSPEDLEGKKEKEFYDYVDKNWKSDKEEKVNESEEAVFRAELTQTAVDDIKAGRVNVGSMIEFYSPDGTTTSGVIKNLSVDGVTVEEYSTNERYEFRLKVG